jgi:hypothetical protein
VRSETQTFVRDLAKPLDLEKKQALVRTLTMSLDTQAMERVFPKTKTKTKTDVYVKEEDPPPYSREG